MKKAMNEMKNKTRTSMNENEKGTIETNTKFIAKEIHFCMRMLDLKELKIISKCSDSGTIEIEMYGIKNNERE